MKFKQPLTGNALIAALRNSDPHAYEFIVEHYFDDMCKIAFGLTNEKATAATVVSLAFHRLWEERESIPDGASILAHLNKYIGDAIR